LPRLYTKYTINTINRNKSKKSKEQTMKNGFALIEKTISHEFYGLKNLSFIADICRLY